MIPPESTRLPRVVASGVHFSQEAPLQLNVAPGASTETAQDQLESFPNYLEIDTIYVTYILDLLESPGKNLPKIMVYIRGILTKITFNKPKISIIHIYHLNPSQNSWEYSYFTDSRSAWPPTPYLPRRGFPDEQLDCTRGNVDFLAQLFGWEWQTHGRKHHSETFTPYHPVIQLSK